jgi:hypothetical protein
METIAENVVKFSGATLEDTRAKFLTWAQERGLDEFTASSQRVNDETGLYEITIWI